MQSLVDEPGDQPAERYWAARALASVSKQTAATGDAHKTRRITDPRLDVRTYHELARLSEQLRTGRTDRYAADDPDTGHDLPEELLSRLDDPQAADLLDTIARDGSPHSGWQRVTAAWQLARIRDPRAADLLADLGRDSGLYPAFRLQAIGTLAELDRQRALNLMKILADDPSLDRKQRRNVIQSRTGKELLTQLPPGNAPLRARASQIRV